VRASAPWNRTFGEISFRTPLVCGSDPHTLSRAIIGLGEHPIDSPLDTIISDAEINVKRFGKNKSIKIFKKSLDKIVESVV
jgi:hypothetical protein